MALTYTNSEAQHRLEVSRRRSAVMSVGIVLLFVGILILLFSIWVIKALTDEKVAVISPLAVPETQEEVLVIEEVLRPEVVEENSMAAPPTPEILSMSLPSVTSLPQTNSDSPLMSFGEIPNATGLSGLGLEGFGQEIGVDTGQFTQMGFTGGESLLKGTLYDLKIDRSRRATDFDPRNWDTYTTPVREIAEMIISGQDPKEYPDAKVVGSELFMNVMMVPSQTANAGPEAFGAEDKMHPKGWMAHYSGQITAPRRGKFRFVAKADDLMLILIDKKLVLDASHASIKNKMLDTKNLPVTRGGIGWQGEWINVSKGETMQMDLFVGENPGGAMTFQLIVEWEGDELEKNSDGRTMYEIFAMQPLSDEEIDHIEKGYGKDFYQLKDISYFGKQ